MATPGPPYLSQRASHVSQPRRLIRRRVVRHPCVDERIDACSADTQYHVADPEPGRPSECIAGEASDDRLPLDEAHIHREPIEAARRANAERVPEIGVPVIDSSDERHHRQTIFIWVVRRPYLRHKLTQHVIPVLLDKITVGRPVLDDVPEAIEREKLKAGAEKKAG